MPCLMGESKPAWGCAVVQLNEAVRCKPGGRVFDF